MFRATGAKKRVNSSPCIHLCVLVTQWCPALCDSGLLPASSSVHGIFQVRRPEGAAMPSSGGSSQPRDQTWASRFAGRFFTIWVINPH